MFDLPIRYRSADEDSARWLGFSFRPGDLVISTRSKSGTTWMQMICALLVFGSSKFPRPLPELSPWLDWIGAPIEDVLETLEHQGHRRLVKTHTPLDGLPLDARATYIIVARDPLDMAVSLYHQSANLDRQRMSELTGAPLTESGNRQPVGDWLRAWIEWDGDPAERLDSLPGVLHHLSDAWRRRDEPNVLMFHYHDLEADLIGQIKRLADHLNIELDDATAESHTQAAGFEAMKQRSAELAPDPLHLLKSRDAFFRRGQSGAGAEALEPADLNRYRQRTRTLAPSDLLAWLDR